MCVVASKCSWNHFISKKYKTVQSFKLHFLQNSPLLQIETSASGCEGVVKIPEIHVVKFFSVFRRILNYVCSNTKTLFLEC